MLLGRTHTSEQISGTIKLDLHAADGSGELVFVNVQCYHATVPVKRNSLLHSSATIEMYRRNCDWGTEPSAPCLSTCFNDNVILNTVTISGA